MLNTYEAAASHSDFITVFDELIFSLFKKNRGETYISDYLTEERVKKATWLASIAALGNDDQKNLASAFGSLLYLYDVNNEVFKRVCYILQSRAGNIVSSQHLPDLINNGKFISDFGSLLNFEVAEKKIDSEKIFEDGLIVYFTDFQKKLWRALTDEHNVAISAPTSSGKSFIIKRFIYEKIKAVTKGEFIYVVPSKALINQVSNELSKSLLDSAAVMTTYRDISESYSKIVYVLTPERCLKLLKEKKNDDPILVFFDEIQNIEGGNRGNVYENIVFRMTDTWRNTQFVMAGPYIENLKKSLSTVTDIVIKEEKTSSTPVLQLKSAITIKPKTKMVDFKIISPSGNILTSEFNIGKSLYSKLTSSRGGALAYIISLFDKKEQNIIYSPKKNYAEKWAIKISDETVNDKQNNDSIDSNQRIIELKNFLSNEIHPSYSLTRMLDNKVAFHHGGLLDVARMEIEDLYSEGILKNIVCTSTLLQGVNLPADRIIIISPKVGNYEMSQFEFLNLIGRAGRINTSLYGEIFCIDVVDEEWGEDKILNTKSKEIKSSVLDSIDKNKSNLISYISLSRQQIFDAGGDSSIFPLISYLRSQYHVNYKHFSKIIGNSSLNAIEGETLINRLETAKDALAIPNSLLAMNQFIDPFEQDILYRQIISDGIDKWLINKYPNSKDGLKDKYAEFNLMDYYNQYKSVLLRLDSIFGIEDEVNGTNDGRFRKLKYFVSINKMAYDSNKWMQGKKYRFFIDDVLTRRFVNKNIPITNERVDTVANFVTAHISTNLNFILVKYLTLWSNIISSFLNEEDKEQYAYILNLPSMLEMGSYNPTVLEIMSFGINRSTAIELEKLYRKNKQSDVRFFLKNVKLEDLDSLHQKYLTKAGFGVI